MNGMPNMNSQMRIQMIEDNKELVDQPSPKFTLIDLEHTIGRCYDLTLNFTKHLSVQNNNLQEVNRRLQALLATIVRCKNDLNSIEMPALGNPIIQQTLNIDKPEFVVCGVQLIENGKLVGTSLYSSIPKARIIRDKCNKEFARLKVNHEAKIVNYPVF